MLEFDFFNFSLQYFVWYKKINNINLKVYEK
jgi:hypothetical protein